VAESSDDFAGNAPERALAALRTDRDDYALLRTLDECAPELIEQDLVHRLVPEVARLQGLDYSSHPWAGLVAGVALCAVDRGHGRRVLTDARSHFASESDDRGHGYACFLEGLEDLGEGKLEAAGAWWRSARELLDDTGPVNAFAMTHLALGAYARGQLTEAIAMAEEAMTQAQLRGDDRLEAIAAMDLGLFRVWTGDFAIAERSARLGIDALARIPDPENRYEEPLLFAELAAVAAYRGEFETADLFFDRALELCATLGNLWYEAITRTVRAEITAPANPVRAIDDVRAAMAYFNWAEESWFVHWTHQALAVAHRELGHTAASIEATRSLLERPLNDLERGRALLCLAETHARGTTPNASIALLREAIELLDRVGARYLAAKSRVLLAGLDTNRGEYLMRAARGLAAGDRSDRAWRLMLRGPGRLQIRLLGEASVLVDGRRASFKTQAELELVAMLALEAPKGLKVAEIADRLWPDLEWSRVSHRVDNLVSSTRRSLLPTTRLVRQRGIVLLDLDPEECDASSAVAQATRLLDNVGEAVAGDEVVALAHLLRKPLLGGPTAQWTHTEQVRLDRLAERLEQR